MSPHPGGCQPFAVPMDLNRPLQPLVQICRRAGVAEHGFPAAAEGYGPYNPESSDLAMALARLEAQEAELRHMLLQRQQVKAPAFFRRLCFATPSRDIAMFIALHRTSSTKTEKYANWNWPMGLDERCDNGSCL